MATYAPIGDEEQQGPMASSVKLADEIARAGFVRKVYGILSAQLLLTVAIAAPIAARGKDFVMMHPGMLYASMGMLLVTMCVMMCCQNVLREFPANYAFLTLFTACTGVLVGFTSALYTWQSVALAAGVTTLVFLGMTAYAFTTKTDFTGCGAYLIGAALSLLCFGFVISILSMCGVPIRGAMMLYDFIGILLFTFYIVYDTQLMLGGNHKVSFSIDEYVFAAMNLYLDIINLFLYLLDLFGDRS
mmetsp:Transcript_148713/g.386658  ORF Transcript_148713/g.386658 Transcript_148713/m.386658 type:complete len:245 (-) Transcript_148713:244-978(-)